jgi:hypothetical protein
MHVQAVFTRGGCLHKLSEHVDRAQPPVSFRTDFACTRFVRLLPSRLEHSRTQASCYHGQLPSCIALASYPMHYIGSPLASIYHDSRSRHARAPARSPPRAPLHPRHAQGSASSYVSLETSFVPWAVPRSLCRVPRGGDSSALVQAHHFIHMFSLVSELLPLTQKLVSHRSGGQTAPR